MMTFRPVMCSSYQNQYQRALVCAAFVGRARLLRLDHKVVMMNPQIVNVAVSRKEQKQLYSVADLHLCLNVLLP